jgi:hypothetical protein
MPKRTDCGLCSTGAQEIKLLVVQTSACGSKWTIVK